MSHPCPNDRTPDQTGKHQQNALPGSGVVVFTVQGDLGPSIRDVFMESFSDDSWGEYLDGEDVSPYEFTADADINCRCFRHRNPRVGVWINEDGTITPAPPEAG